MTKTRKSKVYKPQGTSVGGFDQLDSPHQKPVKHPTRETPTSKVKKPKAEKRPR